MHRDEYVKVRKSTPDFSTQPHPRQIALTPDLRNKRHNQLSVSGKADGDKVTGHGPAGGTLMHWILEGSSLSVKLVWLPKRDGKHIRGRVSWTGK